MAAGQVRRLVVALLMLVSLMAVLPLAASAQGNSEAAHLCQKGGYAARVGAGGETFANAGECVSFAAQGGPFATGIIIPAGQTATLNAPTFSACNALAYGYTAAGRGVALGTKPFGCATTTLAGQTVGPFPTAVVLTVDLEDVTCGATYASDGNHARVISTPPIHEVDIADGGPGCNRVNDPWEISTAGNLSVQVVITP